MLSLSRSLGAFRDSEEGSRIIKHPSGYTWLTTEKYTAHRQKVKGFAAEEIYLKRIAVSRLNVNLPNTVRIATVSSQRHTGFDSENNAVSADSEGATNYMEKLLKAIIMCVLFLTVCEGIVRQHRTIPSL